MKATAKHKWVTSGRLTGAVKGQPSRKPVPPACLEPAYSLYSTDSEDQVTTLHKGLDRCAALLDGILQADKAALASPSKAVASGAAKSRPSTALGKKTTKKLPRKTVQRSSQPCCATPRRPLQSNFPAAHSGVSLHPPQRRTPAKAQPGVPPGPAPDSPAVPSKPRTSVPLPVLGSSSRTDRPPRGPPVSPHGEEDELVPVRDVDPPHVSGGARKVSDTRPVDETPRDTETEVQAKTVQYLLGELKALIAGQGSVAERLLGHLEQAVSSPLLHDGSADFHPESVSDPSWLHSQNMQLRRRVRTLNQQLMEKERQHNADELCNSEVTTLQEELGAAQSRLHEVQCELATLREALQDTRSQLRGQEAHAEVLRTDLEEARSRLADTERERSEGPRPEEPGDPRRLLRSRGSPGRPPDADSSPAERVAQYLMSLGQPDPPHAAHPERTSAPPRDDDVRRRQGERPADARPHRPPGRRWSVLSDCSARSGSTFDTRDEAAFRDGLAALDASIASLQKTLQLDLRR